MPSGWKECQGCTSVWVSPAKCPAGSPVQEEEFEKQPEHMALGEYQTPRSQPGSYLVTGKPCDCPSLDTRHVSILLLSFQLGGGRIG